MPASGKNERRLPHRPRRASPPLSSVNTVFCVKQASAARSTGLLARGSGNPAPAHKPAAGSPPPLRAAEPPGFALAQKEADALDRIPRHRTPPGGSRAAVRLPRRVPPISPAKPPDVRSPRAPGGLSASRTVRPFPSPVYTAGTDPFRRTKQRRCLRLSPG